MKSGLKIITQLSLKFIMLINVKIPTIIGILTFIGMINTTSESLKAITVLIFQYFSFYEQLKFHAQLVEHEKFYNLGARLTHGCVTFASVILNCTKLESNVKIYSNKCSIIRVDKQIDLSFSLN